MSQENTKDSSLFFFAPCSCDRRYLSLVSSTLRAHLGLIIPTKTLIKGDTMVTGESKLSTGIGRYETFKFQEKPVNTELYFYYVGKGKRKAKTGKEFEVLEVIAFDPSKTDYKAILESTHFYSISCQAQIDSFANGRIDKVTNERVGRPIMHPGKFYRLVYTSPVGTEYTTPKGEVKATTSIGYDVYELTTTEEAADIFEAFSLSEDVEKAIAQGSKKSIVEDANLVSSSKLPEL